MNFVYEIPYHSVFYKKTQSKKLWKKMLSDPTFGDVRFVFDVNGEQQRLSAHKNILTEGSEVFKTMFFGALKEKGDVEIVDASIGAFQEFLQFFYLEHVTLTMENIAEVMNMGNKYNVPECLDVCVKFLNDHLTIENACFGLQLANTFNQVRLIELCLEKISEKADEFFKTESFLTCSKDILRLILNIKYLPCDEKTVFDASLDWSARACEERELDANNIENLKHQLGDCFYKIQFAAMNRHHIYQCVTKYFRLFSREELRELFAICANDGPIQLKHFKQTTRVKFIDHQSYTKPCMKFSCLNAPSVKLFEVMSLEHTKFSSNKKLLLGSIAPALIKEEIDRKFVGNLEIYRTSDNKQLLSQRASFHVGRVNYSNCVKLSKPIIVDSNMEYEIRFVFDFGLNNTKAVFCKTSEDSFEHTLEDTTVTFRRLGFISSLYFNEINFS